MGYWKMRLLGVALILVCAFLVYQNWQTLNAEGRFSFKLAAFGPVGIVGGLFLLAFPGKAGKPQTTTDKVIAIGVLLIGFAVGLVNWFLMDPGAFGR